MIPFLSFLYFLFKRPKHRYYYFNLMKCKLKATTFSHETYTFDFTGRLEQKLVGPPGGPNRFLYCGYTACELAQEKTEEIMKRGFFMTEPDLSWLRDTKKIVLVSAIESIGIYDVQDYWVRRERWL